MLALVHVDLKMTISTGIHNLNGCARIVGFDGVHKFLWVGLQEVLKGLQECARTPRSKWTKPRIGPSVNRSCWSPIRKQMDRSASHLNIGGNSSPSILNIRDSTCA